jgi:hypothetical protein
VSTFRLPDMPGIDRADLDSFAVELGSAAAFAFEVAEHVGRYARIVARGVLSADDCASLSDVLLYRCELGSFIRHGTIYCQLKTSAQLNADHIAESWERNNGGDALAAARQSFGMPVPDISGGTSSAVDAIAVRGGARLRRDKGPQKLNGLPGQLVEWLRELSPDDPISRAELLAAAIAKMPEQRSGRGNDRRRDRAREALATCIEKGAIHEQPGDCVALLVTQ